jgi:hypothetical protein
MEDCLFSGTFTIGSSSLSYDAADASDSTGDLFILLPKVFKGGYFSTFNRDLLMDIVFADVDLSSDF